MSTMKKPFYLSLITLLFIINGCSTPAEQPVEEAQEPISSNERSQKVLEHHLGSFGANDLAAVMEDYSEESILITPDSTFTGLAAIEGFFSGLIPAFPTEGTTLELDKMVIENELAYIIWHATTPTLEVPLGTDTFIIENDKIVRQTFAGVINPIN
jgi:hypothetical protein